MRGLEWRSGMAVDTEHPFTTVRLGKSLGNAPRASSRVYCSQTWTLPRNPCSQPALVTNCLALGFCPPPVFSQQGQGSRKPFSTQGGISMLSHPQTSALLQRCRFLLPPFTFFFSFLPFFPPSLLPFPALPLPPFSFALTSSIHSVSGTHFCDSAQPSEPHKDLTAQCLETLHAVESPPPHPASASPPGTTNDSYCIPHLSQVDT